MCEPAFHAARIKTTRHTPQNLYGLTRAELADFFVCHGHGPANAETLYQVLYRDRAQTVEQATAALGPRAAATICAHVTLHAPMVHQQIDSADGQTRKFLLATDPQRPGRADAIETVIMAYRQRYTACVSSQAGCAMGCVFCATGQMGFKRHLDAGEIVAQVMHVIGDLTVRGQALRNIVFMGMGEPLHNFDAVMRAIDIITDHHGIALAPRHITVSTVGLPRRILQLADDIRPIRLAVSLHGASDSARLALVPVARAYPLAEVIDACRSYTQKRRRRIFFEWALIDRQNDTPEQARALAALLGDIPCTINLIPLNPTGGFGGDASGAERIATFRKILHEAGLRSTLRQRRGIDVAAGCGQLAISPDESLQGLGAASWMQPGKHPGARRP